MPYDPERHHRRSVRLRGWDYAAAGLYSVTLCVQDRACLFGEVVGERVRLSEAGAVARACWEAIPEHHARVVLDAFVVMPNHMHGVIGLLGPAPPSRAGAAALPRPAPGSLGVVVGTYKAAVTRQLRRSGHEHFRWQRGYHEHVVRSERTLNRLRHYIDQNPLRWSLDPENPARHAGPPRLH
jgi:REP element-mobilizing transposase RayT